MVDCDIEIPSLAKERMAGHTCNFSQQHDLNCLYRLHVLNCLVNNNRPETTCPSPLTPPNFAFAPYPP